MLNIEKVAPLENETIEELGLSWYDKSRHITDELVEVTEDEANLYYEAANELYDMYVEAAEHVIENDLFFDLGIPFNLVDTIKKSWESDVHWHIYGSFVFSGGVDSKPIKLIDFNADTSNLLFETALLQWAILKENDIDEERQFNEVYEKVSENFKRLITMNDDTELFEERYDGWKILFSSIEGDNESESHTKLLQQMAEEAGYKTGFSFLQNVNFSDDTIEDEDANEYEYWYKNYPWLDLASDEPELSTTLTNIMNKQKAIILNPAYTMLFQSRGMMKILKDLFPNSPYLLETSYEQTDGKKEVERTVFGEGEEYKNFKKVYQEYVADAKDTSSSTYRANVIFSYEACGLCFVKDDTKFVGHLLV